MHLVGLAQIYEYIACLVSDYILQAGNPGYRSRYSIIGLRYDTRSFSPLHNKLTGCLAHTAFYLTSTSNSFFGDKAAGA